MAAWFEAFYGTKTLWAPKGSPPPPARYCSAIPEHTAEAGRSPGGQPADPELASSSTVPRPASSSRDKDRVRDRKKIKATTSIDLALEIARGVLRASHRLTPLQQRLGRCCCVLQFTPGETKAESHSLIHPESLRGSQPLIPTCTREPSWKFLQHFRTGGMEVRKGVMIEGIDCY